MIERKLRGNLACTLINHSCYIFSNDVFLSDIFIWINRNELPSFRKKTDNLYMIWYLKYNQLHINEDIILFFKETENILLMIFQQLITSFYICGWNLRVIKRPTKRFQTPPSSKTLKVVDETLHDKVNTKQIIFPFSVCKNSLHRGNCVGCKCGSRCAAHAALRWSVR